MQEKKCTQIGAFSCVIMLVLFRFFLGWCVFGWCISLKTKLLQLVIADPHELFVLFVMLTNEGQGRLHGGDIYMVLLVYKIAEFGRMENIRSMVSWRVCVGRSE